MALRDAVVNQLRLPSGRLATLTARTLNRRNRRLIERAVAALEVQPGQRLLDLGFGGALSLRLLLDQVGDGQVSGVDPSAELVRRAERIFRPAVRTGRLVVRVGSASDIPFAAESFDRLLTCQTVYFWANVRAGLAELHRVVAPGGRVVIAMMPKPLQERFRFAERGYHVVSHDELRGWLGDAGFTKVDTWPPGTGPGSWIVIAHRP